MKYFAQLRVTNEVIQVVEVEDEVVTDINNNFSENQGIAYLQTIYGKDTIWKAACKEGSFRKNFPKVNDSYDWKRDAFIPHTQYIRWVLNNETCRYEAPIPYPTDGQTYLWDDDAIEWVEESVMNQRVAEKEAELQRQLELAAIRRAELQNA